MNNIDNIKYGIHPVYSKYQNYKLLKGYIVSKCYVLDDNKVQFLYTLLDECINIIKKRGFYLDYSNNYIGLYNDYDSARKACDIKNKTIGLNGNKTKILKSIEKKIEEYTKDIEPNKILIR